VSSACEDSRFARLYCELRHGDNDRRFHGFSFSQRSGSLLFEESDASPPKPLADPKSAGEIFWSWNSLAKKAKAVLLDDGISSEIPAEDEIESAASHEPRSLQVCLSHDLYK
jgi:hypothetical protein